MVEKTHLELQDYDTMMLDEITRIDIENLFKLKRHDVLPYERFDNTWVSVTIERSLDIWHFEREVYTLLELISDVGGFSNALFVVLALTIALWNYNMFDNFMVSRLFKIKKTKEEIDEYCEYFNQSDFINIGRFPHFKECFKRILPKKCWCCKESRREKAL